MLYELITSDEDAFNAFFYGIEGTSYEFVDDQVKALNSDDYGFSACWAARTTEFTKDSYGAPPDLKEQKAGFDKYIEERTARAVKNIRDSISIPRILKPNTPLYRM